MHTAGKMRYGFGMGRRWGWAFASALVFCVSLVMAAQAHAAYEQAEEGTDPVSFGRPDLFPKQLQQVGSMAINYGGAGGVTPGSFYLVNRQGVVLRFSPGEEGKGQEPKLEEQWGWGISEEDRNAYVRCGPAYAGSANPAEHTYDQCVEAPPALGELPGQFSVPMSIAVDQATGNVYVRSSNNFPFRKHHLVEVFTAKGKLVGEGFGDSATSPESIVASPGKLHFSREGGIAVDDSGTVYLLDEDFPGEVAGPQARVASFAPCTAGQYENYCYVSGGDISIPSAKVWWRIALIGNDQLVVASEEVLEEYAVSQPHTRICSRSTPGQLEAMTANQSTGEVFWFRRADHKVHRLAPCNESTGQWQELQAFEPQPRLADVYALAVNPLKVWGAFRPAGVLYGVEQNQALAKGYVFVPAREGVFPSVEGESVANTTASSTTLTATINPRGSALSYHFDYLTEAAYVANGESFEGSNAPAIVPISDGQLASGSAATVNSSVTGLQQETNYRFRVVASSECEGVGGLPCRVAGVPQGFATFSAASGLPDARNYEQVSPAEKHGGEVIPAEPLTGSCPIECKPPGAAGTAPFPMQSTPDGSAVSYMGYPFSPTQGASVFNSYVSARSASGWSTMPMSPAILKAKEGEHSAYSTDLREDVLSQDLPELSAQAPSGYRNLYLQRSSDPEVLVPLVATKPPSRPAELWKLEYGGHTSDFAGQLFAANDVLTGATTYAPEPPPLPSTERDLYEWRDGSLSLVNVLPGNAAVASGASFAAVSPNAHGFTANGRRVFWSARGRVYVREDGQITRELAHAGTFLAASGDGLEVLFSDGCLYSLLSESCTSLTQGQAGLLGMAGASTDLSTIYFVASAALPGSNGRNEEAVAGQPNLYIYRSETGTRFVTTLAKSDGGEGDWEPVAVNRTAEASPNGRYLTFASTRELTGYGNIGLCSSEGSIGTGGFKRIPGPCREIFVYDSQDGRLRCVSCSPTGEAPRGNSTLRRMNFAEPWIPQPRYLTNQGRLFFDSEDRLSAQDVNGRVEDVYEWEPVGVGSCERGGGCLSLISPGTGSVDSNFMTMGGEGVEEGNDVFFTTRDRLVSADIDELIDLYDARVGGGFSSESERQPAECTGEACQVSPGPPASATPSSQSFTGAGNVEKPKCPKGKVMQKGKCVKKKQTKKKTKNTQVLHHQRTASTKKGGAK